MRGICKDSKVRNESEKFGRDRAKSLSHYTVSSGLVRSLPNRPEVESPRRQSELSRRIPNPRKIYEKLFLWLEIVVWRNNIFYYKISFTHDSIIILSCRNKWRKWIFVIITNGKSVKKVYCITENFYCLFSSIPFSPLNRAFTMETDESEGKGMECIIIRSTKMFSIDRNDDASSNVLSNDVYAWIFYRKRCRQIEARFHILVDDVAATTPSIYTSFHICRRQIV